MSLDTAPDLVLEIFASGVARSELGAS